MTKEDLKSKFEDSFDAHSRASEGGMGPDVTDWRGLWRSFEPVVSEYAKQQAIAFAIHYAKGRSFNYDVCKDQVPYDRMDVRYNQFIEQQNK